MYWHSDCNIFFRGRREREGRETLMLFWLVEISYNEGNQCSSDVRHAKNKLPTMSGLLVFVTLIYFIRKIWQEHITKCNTDTSFLEIENVHIQDDGLLHSVDEQILWNILTHMQN